MKKLKVTFYKAIEKEGEVELVDLGSVQFFHYPDSKKTPISMAFLRAQGLQKDAKSFLVEEV